MNVVIWLLTASLVLTCLLLILLVLIQLPKKEAGLGQAFGAGTTDALFGAGTGNVLTKLTKYSTATFFVLTLLISVLQGNQARARTGDPRLKLTVDERLSAMPKPAATATNPAPAAITSTNPIVFSNLASLKTNVANALTNPASNAPAPK